jgi:hypothetical protein
MKSVDEIMELETYGFLKEKEPGNEGQARTTLRNWKRQARREPRGGPLGGEEKRVVKTQGNFPRRGM